MMNNLLHDRAVKHIVLCIVASFHSSIWYPKMYLDVILYMLEARLEKILHLTKTPPKLLHLIHLCGSKTILDQF